MRPHTLDRYPFGSWRGIDGLPVQAISGRDDAVWPEELQDRERYTRAGSGDLGAGSIDEAWAEHKRSDFKSLRDFNLDSPGLLNDLARCYKYWIALTDCDGFRIDTLKHISFEQGRNFCGSIKEFAANLGKENFFLVGEIAGGDWAANRYLEALGRNLNAALDIGEMRQVLAGVAKGLVHPGAYFRGFSSDVALGSHRNLGDQHVSVLDDHDHVLGEKIRFSAYAASETQVAAGVAMQLFTLGIPCIYYGTEQALAGPEDEERKWLPDWKASDRYLREAMFGPMHPRRGGVDSLDQEEDESMPDSAPSALWGNIALIPASRSTAISQLWPHSEGPFRRCAMAGSICARWLFRKRAWKNSISTGRAMKRQEGGWMDRSWPGLASWMMRRCSVSSTPMAARTAALMCWWMRS